MKRRIKKKILLIRDAQSNEEIIFKSLQIEKNLLGLEEFDKAKTVMFYISKGSEVHTRMMIKEAIRRSSKIPGLRSEEIRFVS